MKKITVIPMNPKFDYKAPVLDKKKRVAAYCRVSTDSEEQMTSYEAQVKYYTRFIQSNKDWEFAGIYADEGITGTSVRQRKEFLRLIEDCRAKKIDEIYVKSISRFARNTLDCVSYIRELKDLNINIHFEGLNIDTLDSKGELLITILASIAQEESQNISSNIRWSVEKRFEQGYVIISQIYGYRKDENKMLIIEPNEAVIVRRIYDDFLNGYTANQIAKKLIDDGVPTYSGKSKWRARGVLDILINEKYKGDAVLQKTYKASFLSDKRITNEGQAKQWYVENSHPAIIDREIFDKVQAEIKRRNDLEGEKAGGRYSRNHVFSTIIKCSECGDTFRKFYHYYKGEKIPVWVCRTHQAKKKDTCSMKPIREDRIKDAFVRALNRVIENKDDFIAEIMAVADTVITEKEKSDYDKAQRELNILRAEMLDLNKRNFKGKIDGRDYHDKTLEIMNKIDLLVGETQMIEKIMNEKKLAQHRLEDIREFLERSSSLSEFNDDLFRQMIEGVNMLGDEIEFKFNCGIRVRERV